MNSYFFISDYKPGSTTAKPYLMNTPVKLNHQEPQHKSRFHQSNVENEIQDDTSTKDSLNYVTPLKTKKVSCINTFYLHYNKSNCQLLNYREQLF